MSYRVRECASGFPMNIKSLNRWLGALIVLTALALAWNQFAMEKSFVVDVTTRLPVNTVDDRSSGGKSVASVKTENGRFVMDCTISAGYEWPYCETAFELGRAPYGMDLSGYDTVTLKLGYQGPEPQQQVRVFLLNYNPKYSSQKEYESAKVQEIFYDPGRDKTLTVKLSQFTVASWWSNEHNISVQNAGLEFDNVVALQVSTGGKVLPGPHRIWVERIEFRGKLIAPATFRLIIIGLWMLGVIVYLFGYSMATRRQLVATHRSRLSLQRLNEALQLERQSLQHMAHRDPLTGVLNRHGLGEELLRLSAQGDARLFPLSIVFMDIDHFKRINDGHGHGVGDEVLRNVAEKVKGDIQRGDLFARWGGEEFIIICPSTEPGQAHAMAERLRRAIAAGEWPHGIRVTSSFGVAEARAGEDLAESIRRADEAMYRAKQMGRDRVELHLVHDNSRKQDAA
jgi:diguanylate cyclase (GGDEF)-like protein